MNLNILPIYAMVPISEEWIRNPRIKVIVTRHALGLPIWDEIARSHELVVACNNLRMEIEDELARITDRMGTVEGIYKRKARALHNVFVIAAEATDDPELAAFYLDLDAMMFPQQLRIINLPYAQRAGVVLELERRVTEDTLRKLDELRVCDQILGDVYRAWVDAGKELGQLVQERMRIEASLSRDGTLASQTHMRQVRAEWIRSVRLLLDAIPAMKLSPGDRQDLLTPLERGVQDELARRARAQANQEPLPELDAPAAELAGEASPELAGEAAAKASPEAASVPKAAPAPRVDEPTLDDLAAERDPATTHDEVTV